MNLNVNRVKIVVFCLESDIEKIRNSIYKLGAGIIGNYTCCSSFSDVTGTFLPNEEADPYLGEKNKLEFTAEKRFEIICDVTIVKDVLFEIRKNHSYEEPEIDIYPLLDENSFI